MPPSRLDEIALVNKLRGVLEARVGDECYSGDERYFRSELAQGYPDHTPAQEGVGIAPGKCWFYKSAPAGESTERKSAEMREYLDAGYALATIYCERFFIIAKQSQLKREFQRDTGSNLDTLVGTVLSLSSAGDTATGIVNGVFGAVDATYQSIDDAFLVSPELGNVSDLVSAAQQQHRRNTEKDWPTTFPAARRNIEEYAGYCTYSGMRALVNKSVSEQAERIDEDDEQAATVTDPDQAPSGQVPTDPVTPPGSG